MVASHRLRGIRVLLYFFFHKLTCFPINIAAVFAGASTLYIVSSYIVLASLRYGVHPLLLAMPYMYMLIYIHIVYLAANILVAEQFIPRERRGKLRAAAWLVAVACMLLYAVATTLYYYSLVASNTAVLIFYILLAGVLAVALLDIFYIPVYLRGVGPSYSMH